jgi:hypothetical protein
MQVAQNNLILTDIITKLGLLDYYDVAWKTSQCARHHASDVQTEVHTGSLPSQQACLLIMT